MLFRSRDQRERGHLGEWHTVEVTAFPLVTGPGEIGGVMAIFWETDGA